VQLTSHRLGAQELEGEIVGDAISLPRVRPVQLNGMR
jgi:hypothetical protein